MLQMIFNRHVVDYDVEKSKYLIVSFQSQVDLPLECLLDS